MKSNVNDHCRFLFQMFTYSSHVTAQLEIDDKTLSTYGAFKGLLVPMAPHMTNLIKIQIKIYIQICSKFCKKKQKGSKQRAWRTFQVHADTCMCCRIFHTPSVALVRP